MKLCYIFILFSICSILWTCQNIEDASPSARNSFIKLYEGPYDMTANAVESVTDGFVIVGNMSVPPTGDAVDSIVTVVFKVDKNGNQLTDFKYYEGGTGKSIKHLDGVGYIIVGDSIKRDLNPVFVANGIIASARILIIDELLSDEPLYSSSRSDNSGNAIKADYYGGAVAIDENGNILVLGTYVAGTGTQINVPERPFVANFNYSTSGITLDWVQDYDLIERNYKNSRSFFAKNNKVVWASGIARVSGDVTFSYLSIPYVNYNSTFDNNSTFGELEDQLFLPSDIVPSAGGPDFGYGVVGSYSEPTAPDGSKSNMFFLKVKSDGTIDKESALFFDAVLSSDNIAIDSTLSEIVDEGLSLTATRDGGYVIAGSMLTIPTKGNGARDIFLVKINSQGQPAWNKTIGGAGDEVVSSIIETDDRGLLICGTNTLGGAATVFLIKTDKNGELKD